MNKHAHMGRESDQETDFGIHIHIQRHTEELVQDRGDHKAAMLHTGKALNRKFSHVSSWLCHLEPIPVVSNVIQL